MATQVFFATNRTFDGTLFGGSPDKVVHTLRLGEVRVSQAAGDGMTRVLESRSCDGLDDFAAASGSCGQVLDGYIRAVRAAGGVPFLNIHGFQYSFDEAVIRTAELAEMFREANPAVPAVPLLITWPSSGALGAKDYVTDRQSALVSGEAVARLFEELHARGLAPLHPFLLVHSSGAWALQHAVQASLRRFKNGLPRLFRNVVLAAADVAHDALNDPGALRPLADMADRVTALVLPEDPVLNRLSAPMNGPRLGAQGPPLDGSLPDNVRVLDMSYLVDLAGLVAPQWDSAWNLVGHQYYRSEARVRDAMAALLMADRLPLEAVWRPGVRDPTVAISERAAPFYWYVGGAPSQPGALPGPQGG
ncbi:alpha/beta hydrolase [Muricoccus radiodurans]|uniref:alpha/beta hydrolase n=1 Tax=Muricoccus radiodurans TaxID=2231721 RepID=UPI003CF36C0E